MAESNDLTWEMDNDFIPKYIPDNLKWYEKDGLETWYRKTKCEEFLSDTDAHFKKTKIVNFNIIKNDVEKKKLQQYQTIDHDEIKSATFSRSNPIFYISKFNSFRYEYSKRNDKRTLY